MSRDDIQKIKWAGWLALAAVGMAWASWLSSLAVANMRATAVFEERQKTQYVQLREDIAELKSILAADRKNMVAK